MNLLVRSMPWSARGPEELGPLLTREWLVANGLGGYASGTVSGAATRRYHGLLVAALPNPLGRTLRLNHLAERLHLPGGEVVALGGMERAGGGHHLLGAGHLTEFRLESGLPVWRFEVGGFVLEKRLLMPHQRNTVHLTYQLLAGTGPIGLDLRPSVNFRGHDAPVDTPLGSPYTVTVVEDRIEIGKSPDLLPLRLILPAPGGVLTLDRRTIDDVYYRVEASRGFEAIGSLWSPGSFRLDLEPSQEATLVASTEPWETILALSPAEAQSAEQERRRCLIESAPVEAHDGPAAELVLTADQFLIIPFGRAAGDEARTVIAGYPWFTDWGRDTMISLEGLTLTTGRPVEARFILHTFSQAIRDGLIPNLFPEGQQSGLYHTADATLWFFHAIDRYLHATGDRETLRFLIPKLLDIVEHHLQGTRFGIGVDPADGLLRQGIEGYQLTWMDAKVGDWVVTPRHGKAVEINALWYNALRLLADWVRSEDGESSARPLEEHAARARSSFNRRFWYEDGGYLYDVLDGESGDDPSCRPNQVFAISLPHPILDESRWAPVLDVVEKQLLTPVGLRSLAPGHPDYQPRYSGDLLSRDAAYHQGTVWAWLIGPFLDAWLKLHPDRPSAARRFLNGFLPHLGEACLGSISEIFDAEPPFTPRGCFAQAWSVAEVLRCWIKTEPARDGEPS